jgi:hypothetical protein
MNGELSMHDHGTAVLDRTTEATPVTTAGLSARERWLARCEANLAEALATQNANLLPVLPDLVFTSASDRCQDCRGTGYDYETFDLCYCMTGETSAYDFPRRNASEVLSIIGMARRDHTKVDVWKPCPHCDIAPTMYGPYHRGDLIQVPWAPDCPACHDTGWALRNTVPATAVLL